MTVAANLFSKSDLVDMVRGLVKKYGSANLSERWYVGLKTVQRAAKKTDPKLSPIIIEQMGYEKVSYFCNQAGEIFDSTDVQIMILRHLRRQWERHRIPEYQIIEGWGVSVATLYRAKNDGYISGKILAALGLERIDYYRRAP